MTGGPGGRRTEERRADGQGWGCESSRMAAGADGGPCAGSREWPGAVAGALGAMGGWRAVPGRPVGGRGAAGGAAQGRLCDGGRGAGSRSSQCDGRLWVGRGQRDGPLEAVLGGPMGRPRCGWRGGRGQLGVVGGAPGSGGLPAAGERPLRRGSGAESGRCDGGRGLGAASVMGACGSGAAGVGSGRSPGGRPMGRPRCGWRGGGGSWEWSAGAGSGGGRRVAGERPLPRGRGAGSGRCAGRSGAVSGWSWCGRRARPAGLPERRAMRGLKARSCWGLAVPGRVAARACGGAPRLCLSPRGTNPAHIPRKTDVRPLASARPRGASPAGVQQ